MFLRKTRQKIADLEKLVIRKNEQIYDLSEELKRQKSENVLLKQKLVRKRDKLGRFCKK